jgi:exonuclease SbcC
MISKMFQKSESPAIESPAPGSGETTGATPAANSADKAAWENKLNEAMGNDAALLALARETPLVDVKHAAVLALAGEDALRLAEREFRNNDRRVHRAAKQRHEAMVQRREARELASRLIESAAVLVHESSIPSNRLSELDRAWQALDAGVLDDAQVAAYSALRERLATLLHERAEFQLALTRWIAEAKPAAAHLNAVCAEVAAGAKERAELDLAAAGARAVLSAMPVGDASIAESSDAHIANEHGMQAGAGLRALGEALKSALEQSDRVVARLTLLDEMPEAVPPGAGEANDVADPAAAAAFSARWDALPPIADALVAGPLNARFENWKSTQISARQSSQAAVRQRADEQRREKKQLHTEALSGLVTEVEAALAAGKLTEARKPLMALDEALGDSTAARPLQARIDAVQAEYARLKGWQHWGGGRVRDDLVLEAEALAKASADEKLPLKQHADAIEKLRERWKELDRLGGATSRKLWQRFDGALKTAYLPVAAHLAKLKAARLENLDKRNALIAALDAITLAVAEHPAGQAEGQNDGQAQAHESSEAHVEQNWRELARAVEHFHTEWRKLGPVEHAVPHKARTALLERMQAKLARIEAPLQEVRRTAQLKREKLIERAKELGAAQGKGGATAGRDLVAKVRELQSEWQARAKEIPLARNVENALWGEFKAATDAIFAARDAVFSARDAAFKANQAAREALITRLADLSPESAPAAIKRTIAEAEAEWRKAGEAPRAEAAKLDARFRAARDAAQQLLAGSGKRIWHATCDAVGAKLALCEEAESGAPAADIDERWPAQPALPPLWEQSLHARFKAAIAQSSDASAPSAELEREAPDAVLLQLEVALDIPSPATFQAARRELKLRALKDAMEGRQHDVAAKAGIEKMMAQALSAARLDAASRGRLEVILAALRASTPERIFG